jgi:hypothetical protein
MGNEGTRLDVSGSAIAEQVMGREAHAAGNETVFETKPKNEETRICALISAGSVVRLSQ